MATTWLKALHIQKKKSVAYAIAKIIDYVENPEKTDNGKLITSYECDSRTTDEEFLLSKQEYEYITGRNQGQHNVLAYHIRQAFKPGEVTPEEANKIGYELAMRFTKGNHAFVVCTHIDKSHVHNHIIFNSTTLDCTRKFKDFFFSGRAVRRISDLICIENFLSVIENPKLSKGSYGDWLGDKKVPSWKDVLKYKIDEILPSCSSYDDFISAMRMAGYIVNTQRKRISFLAPGQKKPTRLDTLKGDYTETAIRARLDGVKVITSGSESGSLQIGTDAPQREQIEPKPGMSLLIDIQEKILEGKGAGYTQWAKVFNVKQAAKTLVYLQENGIGSYEELVKKASSASGDFAALTKRIKDIDTRTKEISELQKQIGTYGKTRDIYAKYKASGFNRDFYDGHTADIILHKASKNYFNGLGLKKLPKMADLKQEYATLAAEKKKLNSDYLSVKEKSRELQIVKANAAQLLGVTQDAQNKEISRGKHRGNSQEK